MSVVKWPWSHARYVWLLSLQACCHYLQVGKNMHERYSVFTFSSHTAAASLKGKNPERLKMSNFLEELGGGGNLFLHRRLKIKLIQSQGSAICLQASPSGSKQCNTSMVYISMRQSFRLEQTFSLCLTVCVISVELGHSSTEKWSSG